MAISENPTVVVIDKTIPKLDAYGFYNALRNIPEKKFVPVILMTAGTDAEEEARAFEKGFFDFLTKPIKDVTLITRVKRAFQFYEREYGLV